MKKPHYAWVILVGCCILQFGITGLVASTAGIFFVPVSAALGVGVGTLSLYLTIQNLTMLALYPIAGRLLQKYDLRLTVCLPAAGVYAVLFLMSRSSAVWHFYLAGLLLGVCYSPVMFLAIPMLINNWFQKMTGLALGISLSFSGIGGALFGIITGQVIATSGWQSAYRLLAICGAVLVLPVTFFVLHRHPADMNMLPYGAGETTEPDQGHPDASFAQGYLPQEKAYPFLLLFGCGVGLLAAMQSCMTAFSGSLGFSNSLGATASSAVMSMVIVGKVLLGALNDRLGVRHAFNIACIPSIAAILLFFAAHSGGFPILMTGALLYGVTIALTSLIPPILVRSLCGPQCYSTVYPRVQQPYSLMSALSMPTYNHIYDSTGNYLPVLVILLVAVAISSFGCNWAFRLLGATNRKGGDQND